MYKKVCPYCGKEFEGVNQRTYCSRTCANRGRRLSEKGDFDHSLTWERDSEWRWLCPYHEGVSCRTRKCKECGWNPIVAKARTQAIERKLKGVDADE